MFGPSFMILRRLTSCGFATCSRAAPLRARRQCVLAHFGAVRGARVYGQQLSRGLTLVELLVVIAVIAIVSTIAYPSLQNLVRDGRVVSQANELAAMITYAHSQATQGIPQITLGITPGAPWSASLTRLDEDTNTNIVLREMATANTSLATATSDGLPISINNRGLVRREVCLDIEHIPGGQSRSVSVRVSGQVLVDRDPCPAD